MHVARGWRAPENALQRCASLTPFERDVVSCGLCLGNSAVDDIKFLVTADEIDAIVGPSVPSTAPQTEMGIWPDAGRMRPWVGAGDRADLTARSPPIATHSGTVRRDQNKRRKKFVRRRRRPPSPSCLLALVVLVPRTPLSSARAQADTPTPTSHVSRDALLLDSVCIIVSLADAARQTSLSQAQQTRQTSRQSYLDAVASRARQTTETAEQTRIVEVAIAAHRTELEHAVRLCYYNRARFYQPAHLARTWRMGAVITHFVATASRSNRCFAFLPEHYVAYIVRTRTEHYDKRHWVGRSTRREHDDKKKLGGAEHKKRTRAGMRPGPRTVTKDFGWG